MYPAPWAPSSSSSPCSRWQWPSPRSSSAASSTSEARNAQNAQNAQTTSLAKHPPAEHHLLGSSIKLVDSYRSVNRSLKYVLLFLGLVFLTYFVLEATTGRRVHPAQYVLVGTAQLIFYLLLLSLSEKLGFDPAFLLAGSATVALLATNAGWIFHSRLHGTRALITFTLLYTLIYLLLRLEEDALLIGAISSFLAVSAVMYFTRRIDWYSSPGKLERPRPPTPSSPTTPNAILTPNPSSKRPRLVRARL